MKKRVTYTLLLSVLGLYVLAGALVLRLSAAGEEDDPYKQLEVFSRVLERVRRDYVDGSGITYKELVDNALRGMLSSLDGYSEFMDVTRYEDLKEDTEGAYGGLGLQVQARDGALQVIAPMEDTPAFEMGIMPGDRIVKIDGTSTERMSQSDAVGILRGRPGTDVVLTVDRASAEESLEFKLTRAQIRVYSVKDIDNRREFPLLEEGIGYARITQFGEQTAVELDEALRRMEALGMESLVLDLRGNPGGLLDQAVAVCERFLERGQPIVSTEGGNPSNNTQRLASGRAKVRKYPVVVLVNRGSASASEIVAGALQDLKRAVIVGEQTFGKGSVQSIFPVSEGGALRLTTARYYTPSHKVIHEKGITPDSEVQLTEDEEIAIQLRRIPGGEFNLGDALKTFPEERRDTLRELVAKNRDPQLERARYKLKGISIFTQRDYVKTDKLIEPSEETPEEKPDPEIEEDAEPDPNTPVEPGEANEAEESEKSEKSEADETEDVEDASPHPDPETSDASEESVDRVVVE